MIVVDAGPEGVAIPDLPDRIAGADLLSACAAEAGRQAAALAELDIAIGLALAALRAAETGAPTDPALVPRLVRDLQLADRLRQESLGLARVLALLAAQPSPGDWLATPEVRDQAGLGGLQGRLLSTARPAPARPAPARPEPD